MEGVKEERRREERGAAGGGVARERRAKAELDRRACIVGNSMRNSIREVSAKPSIGLVRRQPGRAFAVRNNRGNDIRQNGEQRWSRRATSSARVTKWFRDAALLISPGFPGIQSWGERKTGPIRDCPEHSRTKGKRDGGITEQNLQERRGRREVEEKALSAAGTAGACLFKRGLRCQNCRSRTSRDKTGFPQFCSAFGRF